MVGRINIPKNKMNLNNQEVDVFSDNAQERSTSYRITFISIAKDHLFLEIMETSISKGSNFKRILFVSKGSSIVSISEFLIKSNLP